MARRSLHGVAVLMCLLGSAAFAQDGAGSAKEAGSGATEEFDREGERCVSTRAIRETEIIDERTILFRMRGGRIYVNNLSNACRSLVRERRFSYRTSTGQLCNVDTIRVIEDFGGVIQEGIACGLGDFFPITEEEAELLSVEARERRGRPRIEVENPNAEGEADAETDDDR